MRAKQAWSAARAAGLLALCGAIGCAGHHGRSAAAAAGSSAGAAGGMAMIPEAPEAGREPIAEAGRGGTAEPPVETAGRGPECQPPIGECFTALTLAPSIGRLFKADLDGDDDLDVIAPGGSMAGWIENTKSAPWHPLSRPVAGEVEYGDVTGDGLADEVSFEVLPCGDCEDTLLLNVAAGDGTGSFAEPTHLETCPVGFSNWHFWLADLDGNGDSEYLLDSHCGDEPQQLHVFDAPFADWKQLHITVEALAAADIDGDSRVDLIAVEHPFPAPPRLIMLRGEGGLRFSAVPVTAELPPGHGVEVQILDLDGDGGRDIAVLVGDAEQSSLVTFRWAAGALERLQTIDFEGSVYGIALASLDADCGDELMALRPYSARFEAALFEVDPAMGTVHEPLFPNGLPELTALTSVPAPDGRDHRLFAHTAMGELVEIAPSSCGPPTE